ncbi:MAG: hypothetical protein ACREFP_10240 [Acetobacteraceae bacterium]
MSLYGEAIAAIKSVILIDERIQSMMGKVDRLADEVRALKERLVRLETIVEVTRPDGAILPIGTDREGSPGGGKSAG